MHRTTRIMATACAFLLTAPISVGAQDAALADPTADASFSSPELVATGDFSSVAMALDADGHRHIATGEVTIPTDEMFDAGARMSGSLWYMTDRDGSWAVQTLLESSGPGLGWTDPSIAVDDDGSVHIAVVDDHIGSTPDTTEGIFYLTDKDRAPGDFGSPVRVAHADMADPSLAVVDGARYLTYHKVSRLGEPPPPAPVFFKTDRSGSWVSHRLADHGGAPMVRVDPTGRAHIIYEAATSDGLDSSLRYVQVDPETGEPSNSKRIPGTRDLWYSSVLALGPSGQPHVAWETSDDIAWSKRTADGWSRPEMLGVRRPGSLSLDVDSTGQPHVVFEGRGDAGRAIIHAQRGAGRWPRSVIGDGGDWANVTSAATDSEIVAAWVPGEEGGGLWSYGPAPVDPAGLEAHVALEDLMAGAPVDDCRAFTEQGHNDPFSYGALAAIHCESPTRGLRQLAFFRFPDDDSMAEYWAWRVDQVEPPPASRDGACADGRRGRARWDHGDLVCYVARGSKEAKLRWTDERSDTYGVIDSTDRDVGNLFEAWSALVTGGDEGRSLAG
jgi:hypothetical protein